MIIKAKLNFFPPTSETIEVLKSSWKFKRDDSGICLYTKIKNEFNPQLWLEILDELLSTTNFIFLSYATPVQVMYFDFEELDEVLPEVQVNLNLYFGSRTKYNSIDKPIFPINWLKVPTFPSDKFFLLSGQEQRLIRRLQDGMVQLCSLGMNQSLIEQEILLINSLLLIIPALESLLKVPNDAGQINKIFTDQASEKYDLLVKQGYFEEPFAHKLSKKESIELFKKLRKIRDKLSHGDINHKEVNKSLNKISKLLRLKPEPKDNPSFNGLKIHIMHSVSTHIFVLIYSILLDDNLKKEEVTDTIFDRFKRFIFFILSRIR